MDLLDASNIDRKAVHALKSGKTVLIAGVCRVDYVGRSESKLEEGSRLVLLKPDGSLLVHIGSGVEPVNWQPPGSTLSIERSGNHVVITSKRRAPPEVLTVTFTEISFAAAIELDRKTARLLYLNEQELYSALWKKPELIEEGLTLLSAQKNIKGYYADFVGVDSRGKKVVIEVKRRRADIDAVKQTYKYLKHHGGERGLLVAPSFTEGAKRLARQLGVELKEIDIKSIWSQIRKEQLEDKSKQSLLT